MNVNDRKRYAKRVWSVHINIGQSRLEHGISQGQRGIFQNDKEINSSKKS